MYTTRILVALAVQIFMAIACYRRPEARGVLLPAMVVLPITVAFLARRMQRDLRAQVQTFSTKLLDRAAGEERLKYEAVRAETLGQPLAVLTVMLASSNGLFLSDLTESSRSGITVQAVKVLTEVLGVIDIAIRWDENNFLILLPGQGSLAATEVGEELQARFQFETFGGVKLQNTQQMVVYDTRTNRSSSDRFVEEVLALLNGSESTK